MMNITITAVSLWVSFPTNEPAHLLSNGTSRNDVIILINFCSRECIYCLTQEKILTCFFIMCYRTSSESLWEVMPDMIMYLLESREGDGNEKEDDGTEYQNAKYHVISFACSIHIKEWILLRWTCILSTRMNINSTQIETRFGINQSWDAQNKGNMRNLFSFVREQGISSSIFHAYGFNMRVQLTSDDNEIEEGAKISTNIRRV